MSEAVEGAEVILYGISEKYKESANVSVFSNSSVAGPDSLAFCCFPCVCSGADAVLCLAVPDG